MFLLNIYFFYLFTMKQKSIKTQIMAPDPLKTKKKFCQKNFLNLPEKTKNFFYFPEKLFSLYFSKKVEALHFRCVFEYGHVIFLF